MTKTFTFFCLVICTALFAEDSKVKKYIIKRGDTVSEVLYKHINGHTKEYPIYGENGLILYTKKKNPHLKSFRKIRIGTEIRLHLPSEFLTLTKLAPALPPLSSQESKKTVIPYDVSPKEESIMKLPNKMFIEVMPYFGKTEEKNISSYSKTEKTMQIKSAIGYEYHTYGNNFQFLTEAQILYLKNQYDLPVDWGINEKIVMMYSRNFWPFISFGYESLGHLSLQGASAQTPFIVEDTGNYFGFGIASNFSLFKREFLTSIEVDKNFGYKTSGGIRSVSGAEGVRYLARIKFEFTSKWFSRLEYKNSNFKKESYEVLDSSSTLSLGYQF